MSGLILIRLRRVSCRPSVNLIIHGTCTLSTSPCGTDKVVGSRNAISITEQRHQASDHVSDKGCTIESRVPDMDSRRS